MFSKTPNKEVTLESDQSRSTISLGSEENRKFGYHWDIYRFCGNLMIRWICCKVLNRSCLIIKTPIKKYLILEVDLNLCLNQIYRIRLRKRKIISIIKIRQLVYPIIRWINCLVSMLPGILLRGNNLPILLMHTLMIKECIWKDIMILRLLWLMDQKKRRYQLSFLNNNQRIILSIIRIIRTSIMSVKNNIWKKVINI